MKPLTNLLFPCLIFALCSCTRYYYRPNSVNAPLFTDAGQARLNLAGSFVSAGNDDGGWFDSPDGSTGLFSAQAAVSPIRHLGIIANYSTLLYRAEMQDQAGSNVNARAHILEGGVGGYYAKGEKFKMVVDGYLGYGGGSIRSDVDMRMRRYFFQPGIGVSSPWFDAAFNLRISNVRFRDFNSKGRDDDYLRQQYLIDNNGVRIDSKSYTFAEPAFTVRTGYKFAKAQFQAAFAQQMEPVLWSYNTVNFSAGISFAIEELFKTAK